MKKIVYAKLKDKLKILDYRIEKQTQGYIKFKDVNSFKFFHEREMEIAFV